MGTVSARPSNLYAYCDRCSGSAQNLMGWVKSTLVPAMNAFVVGATPTAGSTPDAIVDISATRSMITGGAAYGGGGLGDLLNSALTSAHTTDHTVRTVGRIFETAGSVGAVTGPVDPGKRSPFAQYTIDDSLINALMNPGGIAVTAQNRALLQQLATTSDDAVLRDAANRALLQDRLNALNAQLAQARADPALSLPKVTTYKGKDHATTDDARTAQVKQQIADIQQQIAELRGIQTALSANGGTVPHYLLEFDTGGPRGHAVISSGDPYAASTRNIVTQVAGMTSEPKGMATDVKRGDKIFGAAGLADPANQTAVVTWYGYTAPRGIQNLHADVAFTYEAKQGAIALSQFQAQLVTLHQGAPARMTVIAHSYGGVVTGYAALQPGGLHAQNIIYVGSVGTPADGIKAMQADGAHVYSARYPRDIAGVVSGLSLTREIAESVDPGLLLADRLMGQELTTQLADPNATRGVTDLATSPSQLDPLSLHTNYWDDPTVLKSLAAVSTGGRPTPLNRLGAWSGGDTPWHMGDDPLTQ